jgi:hypothetical protein
MGGRLGGQAGKGRGGVGCCVGVRVALCRMHGGGGTAGLVGWSGREGAGWSLDAALAFGRGVASVPRACVGARRRSCSRTVSGA